MPAKLALSAQVSTVIRDLPSPTNYGSACCLRSAGREVVVLGAGGHAKVVLSMLLGSEVKVVGIYDDDPGKRDTELLGLPVLGSISQLRDMAGRLCIIGVGDNIVRRRIAMDFPLAEWMTVVHPKAWVHQSAVVGQGTVIIAGAVIQPEARIGRHCIINTGAIVGAGCLVGDFCHVGPGCNLAETVNLAEGVFMGISSIATFGVHVGAWTVVGAAAQVHDDLPERVVAVDAPARVCRTLATQ